MAEQVFAAGNRTYRFCEESESTHFCQCTGTPILFCIVLSHPPGQVPSRRPSSHSNPGVRSESYFFSMHIDFADVRKEVTRLCTVKEAGSGNSSHWCLAGVFLLRKSRQSCESQRPSTEFVSLGLRWCLETYCPSFGQMLDVENTKGIIIPIYYEYRFRHVFVTY